MTAARDHEQHGAECDAARLLSPPPHLADADSLDRLAREIATSDQRFASSWQRTMILGSLASPPILERQTEVAHDLDVLGHAVVAQDRLEAACRVLDHLTPTAALTDFAGISVLRMELTRIEGEVRTQEMHVSQAAEDLSDAETALRRWTEDHRTCPTCGGALDAASMAEHARTHGGSRNA